jgi:anti-anti-sigma regulatory factor
MDRVSVDLRVPGVALVSLSGEHELYEALKLRERITSLLDSGRSIVVDLTAEYVVVLGRTTREPVRRMFELTGLGGILPVLERDESAPEAPET